MSTQQAPRERSTNGGHRQHRSRGGRLALALTVPVGVLASGALVWQASYAAFTATTENAGNSWTTGTVALTDDDGGSAMFTLTGGDDDSFESKCIAVTYNGTIASTIKLYATGIDGTNDPLAQYIALDVDIVANGTLPGDCGAAAALVSNVYAGTLLDLGGRTFATGVDAWTASTTTTRTYRITYDVTGGNDAQNKSATGAFTWEAQS